MLFIYILPVNFKITYPDLTNALEYVHNDTINFIKLISNLCSDFHRMQGLGDMQVYSSNVDQ